MIDTITFDLWNTLIVNAPPDVVRYRLKRVENLKRILERHGHRVSSDQLLDAYSKGFAKCEETWEKNLDLSTEEQLDALLGFLGDDELKDTVRPVMSELVEAYVSPLLDEPPVLVPGAKEVLGELKRENYKIGLICNTGTTPGSTIRLLLNRLGLIDLFDVTTFSNEFRVRKPDPRIFLHTLNQLGSMPRNSLHIGDLVDVDVLGAKNVGMTAVHLAPDQSCFEEILPDCDDHIFPDYRIGQLTDLTRVLQNIK
jgi:FMN phosphatase YigB (HAD superfamily)